MPCVGLRLDEQVVGERGAERGHPPAAQVGERAEATRVGFADGQDLAELVVRDGDRQAGAAGRAVLDAAQADVEVAARRGRIEAGEADLHEARSRGRAPAASSCATSTSKPTTRERIGGVGLDKRRAPFGVAAPAQLRGSALAACGPRQRRRRRSPTRGSALIAGHHTASESGCSGRYGALSAAALELLERARPVLAQQPRQRAVGEQPSAGLARRAVVRLVRGVDDALHRRAAVGTRLAVAAVHRHPGAERGHLLGKAVAGLGAQPRDPRRQRRARRRVQPPRLVVGRATSSA